MVASPEEIEPLARTGDRCGHRSRQAFPGAALCPGVAQARADAFLDQRSFKFGHGADDLEHRPRGRAQVQVIAEADERYSQGLHFRQGIDELLEASCDAAFPMVSSDWTVREFSM